MYKGWSVSVISSDSMFTFSNNTPTIVKNRCRLDVRYHFFCERVIDRRNSLDQRVIDSAAVNAFRNGLEKNKKYIDRLLYGLTYSSPTPDSLDQVRPHLVCRSSGTQPKLEWSPEKIGRPGEWDRLTPEKIQFSFVSGNRIAFSHFW